ncbi:FtsX-like permease family protein [Psittacicella hinzii]|uniref:Lipoprotein-releasing system permease protein n=1 Tax=Psittacicella hinzii TaxID=2028575 RepID=A0A3A1YHC6_9GAMM|nr:FtsX-like permease family protein [Psittacicella hinzii]RIY37095.1 hypothetical protein CKF58_05385 [Psittacicella hinzii]
MPKNALTPPQAGNFSSGKLTWAIAWRFYRVKATIRVLAFINWLTKLGIILGIAILIMTNAVINGFDQQLHTKFLNLIPQGIVFSTNLQPLEQGKQLAQDLTQFKNVKAVSPIVSQTVLVENGTQKKVIQLFGIDPQTYAQVSSLGDYLQAQGGLSLLLSSPLDQSTKELLRAKAQVILTKTSQDNAQANAQDNYQENAKSNKELSTEQDKYNRPTDKSYLVDPNATINFNTLPKAQQSLALEYMNSPSVVIGKQLATFLEAKVGDYIRFYVFNQATGQTTLSQNQYFLVSGIVDSSGLFDKELAMINIYDATGIVGLTDTSCPRVQVNLQGQISANKGAVSKCNLIAQPQKLEATTIANAMQIRLVDPDNLDIIPPANWTSLQELSYTSWGRIYQNIYHDLPMIKSLLNLGLFFVVTLAGFNVICAILIQIKDKKKSITSLQAVGLSTKQIHSIFAKYSLILALHAVVIGTLIGILLSLALEFLSHKLINAGVQVIDATTYFIDYIPVSINWQSNLIIAVCILGTSLLTALVTSYFANKQQIDVRFLS